MTTTTDLGPRHDLAAACLGRLRAQGATLATAESLTAGMVASTLADVPGASDVLLGGIAAYASEVKVAVLGVDAGLVTTYGVVSRECAAAMARRAVELFGATWAVSTTGVAGPDRQEGQPVGTVYVAVAGPDVDVARELRLDGSRAEIRAATVVEALTLLAASLRLRG